MRHRQEIAKVEPYIFSQKLEASTKPENNGQAIVYASLSLDPPLVRGCPHTNADSATKCWPIFSNFPDLSESFRKLHAIMFPTRALLGRSVWKGKPCDSIPILLRFQLE